MVDARGAATDRVVRHSDAVRRFVNLNRAQVLALLATGTSSAHDECAEAVRSGTAFRVHSGTVTREGVLRIYALRAQTAELDGTRTLGIEEALKELAATKFSHLRLAAISAKYDFVMFMDPECHELVACLGVEGRTNW